MEEEREFLAPWLQSAVAGNLLVVAPIRAALAERLGQPVKASVVYRMLARHDWRKVAPDTRHPKSSLATQQEWEKTREALAALLIPEQVKGRRVRLMFKDEARFGAWCASAVAGRQRRCWAPAPVRPVVDNYCTFQFFG